MSRAASEEPALAYETRGTGTPVVFLHGLTFDRRTWRPIIETLGDSVRSIAIDLPAHGDSGGVPAGTFTDVARMTIDPVCDMAVTQGDGPHYQYGGRTWWFCSTGCREEFAADPGRFARRASSQPGAE
jgi:YHS domain-containing protein